jgi:hypothetical protein
MGQREGSGVTMPSQKWLNWSPSQSEIVRSGQNGNDRTDNDPVLSVLSVQGKPEHQDSETSIPIAADQAPQSRANRLTDPDTEALQKIAGLLAVAYQRFARVPRVSSNPANNLAQDPLALSGAQSVHECD